MRIFYGWRRFVLYFLFIFFLVHLSSVLDVNQSPNVKQLHRKQIKKFDHLVFGPAAGQGLRDRLQCKGFKALNKTQFSTSSSLFNVKESIAFVTVFTSYNSTPVESRSSDLVTVGNASYNKGERAMAILNVFINFIQVLSPKNPSNWKRSFLGITFRDSTDVAVEEASGTS